MSMQHAQIVSRETISPQGLYFGITPNNQKEFRQMILRFLKSIDDERIVLEILSKKNMDEYIIPAFTSKDVNEHRCYEPLELIGDGFLHAFMSQYFADRFPFLMNCEGVKVTARLKINYGSNTILSRIAEQHGFWNFISASVQDREEQKDKLLEDVFEAIFGAIQIIVNNKWSKEQGMGVGYGVCYTIAKNIYDKIPISLRYDDLYDGITRLKELFDLATMNTKYGKPSYIDDGNKELSEYKCSVMLQGKMIAFAVGNSKQEARQLASCKAIEELRKRGIYKAVSIYYQQLERNIQTSLLRETSECPSTEGQSDVSLIDRTLTEDDIKEMFHNVEIPSDVKMIDMKIPTREKPKYFKKNDSTVLAMCCRKRNLANVQTCLRMGANSHIPDSDGMSCVDLVLISGEKLPLEESDSEVVNVIKILREMCKSEEDKHTIRREVYVNFFQSYCEHEKYGSKFKKLIPFLKIYKK